MTHRETEVGKVECGIRVPRKAERRFGMDGYQVLEIWRGIHVTFLAVAIEL